MNARIDRAGQRRRVSHLEILSLTALALLAIELAIAFPAQRRDEILAPALDYVLYFQSHQLFQCDPEQLSERELNDLKQWCRCLRLTTRHDVSGVQSLTDEECQFVVQTLDDLCPDTAPFAGFRRIHQSCRQSLDHRQAAIASHRESPSHDRPLLLE
jgi:hypothetical protein